MAFDATLGGSEANSYVELTYADDYFTLSPYAAEWAAFSDDAKQIALVQACSALETVSFAGTRCSPSSNDPDQEQSLAWPRSGAVCDGITSSCGSIPKQIGDAQCLLALNLATTPDAITGPIGGGGTAQAGVFTSMQKLGDLEQQFTERSNSDAGSDCTDCATPAVIAKFSWLKDALGCWATIGTSTSKVLLRVRS